MSRIRVWNRACGPSLPDNPDAGQYASLDDALDALLVSLERYDELYDRTSGSAWASKGWFILQREANTRALYRSVLAGGDAVVIAYPLAPGADWSHDVFYIVDLDTHSGWWEPSAQLCGLDSPPLPPFNSTKRMRVRAWFEGLGQ